MDSRLASCAKIVGVAVLLGGCMPLHAPVMADGMPWTVYVDVDVDPALEAGMPDEAVEQRRTVGARISQRLVRDFAEIGFHVALLHAPQAYSGPRDSFLVRTTVEHHESGSTAAQNMGTHFVGGIAGADMPASGSAMVTVSYQLLDGHLELMQTNQVSAESGRRWESAVDAACRQIAEEVTQALNHAL